MLLQRVGQYVLFYQSYEKVTHPQKCNLCLYETRLFLYMNELIQFYQ